MVFGISPDQPAAQKKFKEEHSLPYSLLADPEKNVAKKFGVLQEKVLYGRKYMGIERTTFVIDGKGTIVAVVTGVKPEQHAEAVLQALKPK